MLSHSLLALNKLENVFVMVSGYRFELAVKKISRLLRNILGFLIYKNILN